MCDTNKTSSQLRTPDPNHPFRREEARAKRNAANEVAFSRQHLRHQANQDESVYWDQTTDGGIDFFVPMSFTKGLPHDPELGTVSDIRDYEQFAKAIDSGKLRDFRDTPLGHPDNKGDDPDHASCDLTAAYARCQKASLRRDGIKRLFSRLKNQTNQHTLPQLADLRSSVGVRAWESQSAGLSFDLEGPDAQAVTMPPAPALNDEDGSRAELIGEIAEVYAQALLRDVPFTEFEGSERICSNSKVRNVLIALNELNRKHGAFANRISECSASKDGTFRPKSTGRKFTPQTLFRGITPGDLAGPYLSQFLLIGNNDINGGEFKIQDGQASYGAQTIDQRVRYALPNADYMTTWEEWYSVQCAASVGNLEAYADQKRGSQAVDRRLMLTPRDLSTYVHYDALYQAYLNACLILLSGQFKDKNELLFDPGIPFQRDDSIDHQQGFAHFGGPHILSLVTEVATRALKAVRFQKFNVHRRLRPEALAARIEKADALNIPELQELRDALEDTSKKGESSSSPSLLEQVRKHNAANNGKGRKLGEKNVLLPMAFTEGSPMHPTYGAGHATVAGACVTVLKAFFNGDATFRTIHRPIISSQSKGETKLDKGVKGNLTVEGELNKLAANISIGRDFAGVHYYSDYVESIRMGEEIAIGILEEQKLMFRERFHMTFTSFDGHLVSI
ncbi:MAG: vanadium-dependent haloperoxidase [Verrucomicrobiota bacterium]